MSDPVYKNLLGRVEKLQQKCAENPILKIKFGKEEYELIWNSYQGYWTTKIHGYEVNFKGNTRAQVKKNFLEYMAN